MKQRAIKNVGPFSNCDMLTIDAEIWIKQKYDYTCLRCFKREPEIRLVIDHVVPKSKGGPHTVGNAQPLCVRCNAVKGIKTIDYRTLNSTLALDLTQSLLETVKRDRHITYQYQYRKCGKIGCSTCNGDQGSSGHGPYWYGYWRENGRLISAYVGRVKPSAGSGNIGTKTNAVIAVQGRLF